MVKAMSARLQVTPDYSSPRLAAFQILQQLANGDLHADDLLNQELSRNRLQGPDRGLLAELVMGVLRRQATLDHSLRQLVQQPLDQLEQPVLLLLRLGLYQLQFLDRVPAHAAVHESVELTKATVPRAKGLINGVLRSFLRRQHELSLPDPALNPAAWLVAAHSLPDWLARQWLEQLPLEEATALALASLALPLLTLRTNTLRITRPRLLELFAEAGICAEPCRFAPEAFQLKGHLQIPALPGFAEGLWTVQDQASQLVSHLLDPQPGERLLDICAAPGGKATHLAQLMGDRGTIVATDLNRRRIKRINEVTTRLGLQIIQPRTADALAPDYLAGEQFDRILLDAPCSGLGVIRRHPEAKWRLTPAELERCAARQRQLLAVAAGLLRPGGILVYATCSTAVIEDEAVINDFLSRHPDFVVDTTATLFQLHPELATPSGTLRLWPHRHGCDGFFAVRLARNS